MGFITLFRLNTFNVERAVTSNFLKPQGLVATRAISTLYLFSVLVGALATTPSFRYFISFFTNISFCALIAYFVWSLVWSVQYSRLAEKDRDAWIKRRLHGWGIIYWILYSSSAVFHIIVPLVYWTFLRSHQKPHTGVYEWATVSEHSMDGVFMIVEIVCSRMVMDVRHLPFTLLFMALYLLVTFVHWWSTGLWVYSFLDYITQGWTKTVVYYVGVAVGLVVVYLAVWKLHDLREYLALRRRNRSKEGVTVAVHDLSSVSTELGDDKLRVREKDVVDMV
ncbi:hypothetical protein EC968_005567 [Mortierella alpina]|nr:hypothetical protein EC968_005567 [Mortierella alpina]